MLIHDGDATVSRSKARHLCRSRSNGDSSLVSSRPAPVSPRPRLACQTPTFLRKCLPPRSLFERKRHGGGLSGARPSRRRHLRRSLFHKQTRPLSSLNSRHPPARTKLATADCNYSALSVNETSACRRRRPTRYDGSLAMRNIGDENRLTVVSVKSLPCFRIKAASSIKKGREGKFKSESCICVLYVPSIRALN